jgi:hypothetical protein
MSFQFVFISLHGHCVLLFQIIELVPYINIIHILYTFITFKVCAKELLNYNFV